jgi:hypothetical protein
MSLLSVSVMVPMEFAERDFLPVFQPLVYPVEPLLELHGIRRFYVVLASF